MSGWNRFRKRVFEIIEKSHDGDVPSLVFDWFIIVLIIANICAVILESYGSVAEKYGAALSVFETVSVVIFSIEILLRWLTCDFKFPAKNKFVSFVKYSFSFMAVIDFLAVLPFYLPFMLVLDLRFLRVLRLTRILRILKVQRYNRSLQLIGRVFQKKNYDLLVTLFITFLLLLLSGAAMYFVETDSQPEKFPNIMAAFWWAVSTLTTVGYGDVFLV